MDPDPANQFTIRIEAFDEFGNPLNESVNTIKINITHAIASPETPEIPATIFNWFLYLIAGFVGLVLLIAFFAFVMWKKVRTIQLPGRAGETVAKTIENIKKTIVGGGNRKPLFILNVTDGPKKMIGQDLKIYTESVKLGRDSQKADLVFYDLETNTSVSGLHALIERVDGMWRIVAVSQSGSETSVNGVAIPLNKPRELRPGDVVRLGSLAQQPVEFKFISDVVNHLPASTQVPTQSTNDPDKTALEDISKTNIPPVLDERSEDGQKTDVNPSDIESNIAPTEEEKKKFKPDPDSVDNFIKKLRKKA
jgi:hypothetical protein